MTYNILLACERSAGHIFPALVVAQVLRRAKDSAGIPRIFVFATAPRIKTYINHEEVSIIGKSFSFRNLFLESIFRFFEAMYLLVRYRPRRVIGFGGRDSFFLVLFAACAGIRTAIYEPNVTMGKANTILSFFVREILRGFAPIESSRKSRLIGIPLRPNIIMIEPCQARRQLGLEEKPVIFCFGGSQGSSFLNQTFIRFIEQSSHDFQIIHLTGTHDYRSLQQFYTAIKRNAFIRDFYYNMEVAYSAADIVIARAGAITLGEISFYGRAAILIPHPQAGSHQKENARYFSRQKAALMFEQNNFSFGDFCNAVDELLSNQAMRQSFSNNMRALRGGVAFEDFYKSFYC